MAKGTKSLSLQKFAGAKKSKYDKRAKAEKKAARRAKIINKYHKLKTKLSKQGLLASRQSQVDEDTEVRLPELQDVACLASTHHGAEQ